VNNACERIKNDERSSGDLISDIVFWPKEVRESIKVSVGL